MSLRPINILQAAEADLMRRIRNKGSMQRGRMRRPFELYAFHRDHVRKARGVCDLLVTALMQPAVGLRSKKRNTKMLYGDGELLVKTLRLLQTEYGGEVQAAATEEFV